jgi:hypothetical protein
MPDFRGQNRQNEKSQELKYVVKPGTNIGTKIPKTLTGAFAKRPLSPPKKKKNPFLSNFSPVFLFLCPASCICLQIFFNFSVQQGVSLLPILLFCFALCLTTTNSTKTIKQRRRTYSTKQSLPCTDRPEAIEI